MFRLFFYYFV